MSVAKCMGCGNIMNTTLMVPTFCANRGSKPAYMCEECATENEGYATNRQMKVVGGVNDGFRYGIELETNYSSLEFRNMMFRYDFRATSDCSLNEQWEMDNPPEEEMPQYDSGTTCEYVSSTNKGLKRFQKQFIEIEKYLNDGQVAMDSSCGTHCHISYHNMMGGEMEMIQQYYKELFLPIQKIMQANISKTVDFFGRYFCGYAPLIREDDRIDQYSHNNRYRWINAINDNNLEFRLNKFTSASQMIEVIKLEKWIVTTIVNNFTSKYHETPEADRRALAIKTGGKIAKKLVKIYSNMF